MKNLGEWVVSVDDHVIEPPDVWTSRLSSKYQETCPRVLEDEFGEAWFYNDRRITVGGSVTGAGLSPTAYDPSPQRYADMRPACYDPLARIAVMNEDGVAASLAFPNFPRFCGQEFYEAQDRKLGLLCVKAYNDFMLDEWAGSAPGRLVPLTIIPLWDPHLAAQEIERCAAKGARSIAFSEHPPSLGLPSIHDPNGWWDPVFSAASGADMPLSIHIGSSSTVPSTGVDSPRVTVPVLVSYATATTCTDWLFCDALARFPDLKISLAEGGIGWLPFLLQSAERQMHHYQYMGKYEKTNTGFIGLWHEREDGPVDIWPHGDRSVLDVFRDHIRGCFISGDHGVMARETFDILGSDLFMAEVDFPHLDSTYPGSQSSFSKLLAGLDDEDARRLRSGNAIEWFGLDGDQIRAVLPAQTV
jgi:predicted TIM-barrel fold metal-dependent hydrolase